MLSFDLVQFRDIVDVLLVTALVYFGLVSLRRTRAFLVAIGLVMLGAVYLGARALDLRLTSWVFQGFFALFIVIVVIIFQEELRQLFERVAVWSLRRGSRERPGGSEPADILVECLTDLARRRIGALVVLPGAQPIDRHVRGGIELDGKLTAPLLTSIFDPHSPGHDGAVVVEGDRIRRFATHLPLSSNFAQLGRTGTRHSAALGLSEVTDALSIVVSEEQGTIAVARDGRLTRIADTPMLRGALAQFLHAGTEAPERSPLRRLLFEHGLEKLAALAVVGALWVAFVPGSRPMDVTYRVPVNVVHLPDQLALEAVRPETVEVTLSGPRRAFYLFNPRRLEVIVDASLADAGRRTFPLLAENVRHPPELSLQTISPTLVRLDLKRTAQEEPAADDGARAKPAPG